MRQLVDGIFRWELPHPAWSADDAEDGQGWDEIVASHLVETDDGPVLIDPLVADDGWEPLDEALRGRKPHVLLTIFWHTRSTPAVLERYTGARAWVHEPAADLVRERGVEGHTFVPSDPLPGGIEAVAAQRAYEVAFLVPEKRGLVVGDLFLGTPDGGARLLPRSWFAGEYEALVDAVRRVFLPLEFEHLLLAHGAPVLRTGREALSRALHSPPSAP